MKKFSTFIVEKLSKENFDDINKLYVGGLDDSEILDWIEKHIKGDSNKIYKEFKKTKG